MMNEELNQGIPTPENTAKPEDETTAFPAGEASDTAAEASAAAESTAADEETSETSAASGEPVQDITIPQQRASAQSGEYHAQEALPDAQLRYNPYTGQPYAAAPQQKAKRVKEKKEHKPVSFIKKLAATVALALVFGAVSGAVILGMNYEFLGSAAQLPTPPAAQGQDNAPSGDALQNRQPGTQLASATDAMRDALKKADLALENQLTIPQIDIIMKPAMVSINVSGYTDVQTFFGTTRYPFSGSGSGIIVGVNETELLIATNNHVIDNADEISVQFVNETSLPAFTKGTDAKNDLAIIAIPLNTIPAETAAAIAYAELGDSDALVIGEGVVAVGNALGFGQSVTNGIVSALNRAVTDSEGNVAYMIQTNAAINPGNSGGALVNMQGQVIGINSAKYSDEAVEGMCFAIPINTALPILEELMARTTRTVVSDSTKSAYLGIVPQDVNSSMSQLYGMPQGVYVSEITAGSAADKAGMIKGDIITSFDGENVTTVSAFRKLLSYYEAGESVKVTVQRYERGTYSPIELTVTLDRRPEEDAAASQNNVNGQSSEENELPDWWGSFFGGR